MNRKSVSFILLWASCDFLAQINGANILGLMPIVSPSHHIWNSVLMHKLGELGHNITILSVDIPKAHDKIPPSVHYIHLETGYSVYNESDEKFFKFDLAAYLKIGKFQGARMFSDAALAMTKLIFDANGFQTLLNYPDDFKFDLVIHDYTLGPGLLGFLHKFNYPPAVGISAFHNPPITMDFMSNHYFPAYIPFHSTTFKTEMNFWERLENTLLIIYDTGYRCLVLMPKLDALARNYFPYKDMPYLADLAQRTAIALVNSHPATNYVEPLPQNVIEVGGMQILDPKPLPEDLEDWMNKSKNGVVFFSFGTNMKSQDIGNERVRFMVNAMAALPQYNFMWKFDVKYLKEKIPENVLVKPFFPQRDILGLIK